MEPHTMLHIQKPNVSVVVPTYNRGHLLEATLQTLSQVEMPHNFTFEVIICDDGSSDDTSGIVRSAESTLDLKYCYQPDRGSRQAAARNMGVKLATADTILFIDSEVLVAPNLIEKHLCRHTSSNSVVIGLTYGYYSDLCGADNGDPFELSGQAWWIDIDKQQVMSDVRAPIFEAADYQLDKMTAPWTLCWGNNFSVPKAALLEVGGFDELFIGWGYEDLDLAYRLHKHGLVFQVAMDAITLHLPHVRVNRSVASVVENIRRLYEKNPTLLTELLNCFGTLDYSNNVDKFLLLAQYSLTPKYHFIWDDSFKQQLRAAASGQVYIMGCEDGWLSDLLDAKWISHPDEAKIRHLKLEHLPTDAKCGLGVMTGKLPKSVDSVVITDFWRVLHEEAIRKMTQEAIRISKRVVVLNTPSFEPPPSDMAARWGDNDLKILLEKEGLTITLLVRGATSDLYEVSKS